MATQPQLAERQSSADSSRHRQEVLGGERFEFGANWARFLSVLNDSRIALAEKSLKDMLRVDRLDGKTFLDAGSGSGLFSLVARRLGAKVHSFDYDPQSVACTRELRRRYFHDDADWRIEQGSVLDTDFLAKLGEFDIVYSWGVLHHTGQMWQALENVKPLTKLNGTLFIAIYNDLREVTDRWSIVKQRYNSLPRPLATLYALKIIASEEKQALKGYLRNGGVSAWLRSWSEYDKESTRGMSKWHDWIDWIGGYPYERATVERIVDYYAKDGFSLMNLADRSFGYGCNEFVFCRKGALGEVIDSRIPGGTSVLHQYGWRVAGPFNKEARGWTGRVSADLGAEVREPLIIFTDGRVTLPASGLEAGRVVIAPYSADERDISTAVHFAVRGRLRQAASPFRKIKGNMWAWEVADLAEMADDRTASRSPVYLLEDGRQLPLPHSIHADIARTGRGRFSHWGNAVYFATSDNTDPNANPDRYQLLIAARSV